MVFFFFNDPATTEIYTLSLHDALPIYAGGRGKAGGVKVCDSDVEIHDACEAMFGMKLVTHQTGPEGKGVYRVYVETAVPIAREIYLGFVQIGRAHV